MFVSYAIVAPHSLHGGEDFDAVVVVAASHAFATDCDDNDESVIFIWTIGVFVESVVCDSGLYGCCCCFDASDANVHDRCADAPPDCSVASLSYFRCWLLLN